MIILLYIVVGIVALAATSMVGCVALAWFTDDAVLASGCIEEGQTW